jgi:hypothetical protein
VAIGSGDDPTAYLDGGTDAWWEDAVLPVMPLTDSHARELVHRYLTSVHAMCDSIPSELYQRAGGLPRELLRRARSLALQQTLASRRDVAHEAEPGSWMRSSPEPAPYELTHDETTLMAVVEERGSLSLSHRPVLDALGWSYGKTHRLATALVERGILTRTEVAGDTGRPRVFYSAVAGSGGTTRRA